MYGKSFKKVFRKLKWDYCVKPYSKERLLKFYEDKGLEVHPSYQVWKKNTTTTSVITETEENVVEINQHSKKITKRKKRVTLQLKNY